MPAAKNKIEHKYDKDIILVARKIFFEKRHFSNFQKQPPEAFLKTSDLRTTAFEL